MWLLVSTMFTPISDASKGMTIMKNCIHPHVARRPQSGFTLVELSVVLLVIGLMVGAVAVGTDLQRNAAYQRLGSSFVNGWNLAYLSYKTKWGVVVADDQATPTGYVKQGTGTEVCGDDSAATSLRSYMLAAGVEMPQGRAEGMNTRYSYLDSNGNPQEMQVCFNAIPWMEETATPLTYKNKLRNVMVLKQVTPDLARMIDSLVDTARDAQFGKIRQYPAKAGDLTPAVGDTYASPGKQEYSLDNTCVQGSTCGTAYNETQVKTMTIYYLMD